MTEPLDDPLTIAGQSFASRLLIGSSSFPNNQVMLDSIEASEAQIVTVAIRRVDLSGTGENILDLLEGDYFILPNTAGCYTAKDAVRTCQLARELLGGHTLVKLEVLGDEKTLYPNVVETLAAAQTLVDDGFDVMVYTSDDPIIAKELENIGCCAVMPLASLIGSGQGIANPANIKLIKEQASVPVLVDAGIGCASDAAKAMELGCDGVLMNSAIANAQDPALMASAMKHAVIAGRESFLAGRMMKKAFASASSPMENLI